MNQSNLIQRLCCQHKEIIILACQQEDCIENLRNKLICQVCLREGYHYEHFNTRINMKELEEKLVLMQSNTQKLINIIKKYQDNIQLIFNNIEKEITKQYDYSFQTLNSLQNGEFNQYIQKIITFNDFEKLLNQNFIKPIQEFEEKINKFFNNLSYTQTLSIQQDKKGLQVNDFFQKGYKYFQQKKYEEALNQFDQALHIDKNHVNSLTYTGRTLYWLDKVYESIDFFNKALKLDEYNVIALWSKGLALGFLGNYKDSILCYDKVFIKEPNCVEALRGKGDALRMQNLNEKSLKWYGKAIEVDSNCKEALCGKADSLRNAFKPYESLKYYTRAIDVDSSYKQAFWGKGEALRILKRYDESLDCFNQALLIDSNYSCACGSKGAVLLEKGNFEVAEQLLLKALKINKNDQFARNQLTQLQLRRGMR